MSPNRKKQIIITVSLCLAIGSVLFFVMLVHAGRNALEAETRSWATSNTCLIITQYINQSDTPRWPTSWNDLAGITCTVQHPYWPDERAYYEQNVSIDFGLTLSDVAAMTQENFDAVEAVGPDNRFQDYQYQRLIDAAQEATSSDP